MNKTEQRYSAELELQKLAGLIIWWAFEPVTLRLAKKTSLTPDFMVQRLDGFEFIDTKGRKGERYWCTEDSKIKIKVAARTFPMFKFAIVWESKAGLWQREDF